MLETFNDYLSLLAIVCMVFFFWASAVEIFCKTAKRQQSSTNYISFNPLLRKRGGIGFSKKYTIIIYGKFFNLH